MTAPRERSTITGQFYRRIYTGREGYTIDLCSTREVQNLPAEIKASRGRAYITVCGSDMPDLEQVQVRYNGIWERTARGTSFRADSYEILTPDTEKGLVSFLASDLFRGVGKKTAKRLVQRFGKDVLDILETEPERFLGVKGITEERLRRIVDAYASAKRYSSLITFLGPYGISREKIVRIASAKIKADEIRADPYQLMDIKGISFRTCDQIARGLRISLDSSQRIQGALIETVFDQAVANGDMYIEKQELLERTEEILNSGLPCGTVREEQIERNLRMMNPKKIVIRSNRYIFLRIHDDAESFTARKLAEMSEKEVENCGDLPIVLREYQKDSPYRFSVQQIQAVQNALTHRVSVITGGPGTGKTTILKMIIACYLRMKGGPVTCLAPTGKAARRMSEATGIEASTIHARLGLFDSQHIHRVRPISQGLVIVDEASMVDSLLMYSLMQAVSMDCQLLFVGDVSQLPSVGAGAVLSEMIRSQEIFVTELTEIFRQKEGSTIIDNAVKINRGETDLVYDADFVFFPAENEEEAVRKIREIYPEECRRWGIDHVALLAPLRRTQNGRFTCCVEGLNPILQEEVNPHRGNDPVIVIGSREFRLNDRVLQWENNETSSNGDTGVITDIYEDEDDGMTAVIRWDNGNTVQAHRENFESISLAYALSVHKSQGSEYESVIIPMLSEQSCRLIRRNLLYTAVTRAKKRCIIVGDIQAVEKAVCAESGKRKTLLAERIRHNKKQRV